MSELRIINPHTSIKSGEDFQIAVKGRRFSTGITTLVVSVPELNVRESVDVSHHKRMNDEFQENVCLNVKLPQEDLQVKTCLLTADFVGDDGQIYDEATSSLRLVI